MAISIIGQMKVGTLKAKFHEEFGLTLRIYDGRSFANESSTIAQVRIKKGAGELNIRKNMKVGNLEDKIKEDYGIKTQVAGSDDSYLCNNDFTLAKALEEDTKKLVRKEKKGDNVSQNDLSDKKGGCITKESEMHKKMRLSLEAKFDSNIQKIRRKKMFGDTGEKLSLPALSGPTGIGKTASVKEFSQNKGFHLITIDCSYEPANFLVIHLNNAITNIADGKIDGCVLLLDNINEAGEDFLNIINQYRTNSLNSFMEVNVPDDNGKPIKENIEVSYNEIPENIFIVGEQTYP